MEHMFEGLQAPYFQHFDGQFYRKNKHIVDVEAEKQGFLNPVINLEASVGQKRKEEHITIVKEEITE